MVRRTQVNQTYSGNIRSSCFVIFRVLSLVRQHMCGKGPIIQVVKNDKANNICFCKHRVLQKNSVCLFSPSIIDWKLSNSHYDDCVSFWILEIKKEPGDPMRAEEWLNTFGSISQDNSPSHPHTVSWENIAREQDVEQQMCQQVTKA